jgi:hypothetical protein
LDVKAFTPFFRNPTFTIRKIAVQSSRFERLLQTSKAYIILSIRKRDENDYTEIDRRISRIYDGECGWNASVRGFGGVRICR